MKIKRYEGQYVHEVIAQVRDELGPEAVVLHTRWRQAGGLKRLLGRPQVEVWAGVPDDRPDQPALLAPAGGPAPSAAPELALPMVGDPQAVRAQALRQALERVAEPAPCAQPALFETAESVELLDVSPQAQALSREELTVALLAEFNDALERIEAKVESLAAGPLPAVAASGSEARRRALIESGVESAIATEIAAEAEGRSVADVLHETFTCTGELRLGERPRVVALIGPSGVGKTTTVAKLAGRYAVGGEARVLMLSADGQRVGTFGQLQAFGELMQVPTAAARTPAEAQARLRLARSHCDLVLVDTPACHAASGPAWERLLEMLISLEADEIHLVLPAAARPADARRLIDGFAAALPLSGLILTKTDEAEDLGLLANIAWHGAIPFSFLADGPDAPGDLELATAHGLAQKVWSARLSEVARPESLLNEVLS
jgi:flagellar biosynthesis protein FlhF